MTNPTENATDGHTGDVQVIMGEPIAQEALPAIEPASTLYTAIHAVMGEVVRMKQTGKRDDKAGKYKFTPADDFRDFLREQFVKHGLTYIINEMFSSAVGEIQKGATVKFQYQFCIVHVATGEITPWESRSVFLPYVGSQTSGIASTFAFKEWVKNKFLISTGEIDPENAMDRADAKAQNRLPFHESEAVGKVLRDKFAAFLKDKPDSKAVHKWWDENLLSLNTLDDKHFLPLQEMAKAATTINPDEMSNAELDKRTAEDK